MPEITIKNAKDLTIESDVELHITDFPVINLIRYLDELNSLANLSKFDVVRDAGNPNEYSYEFKATDGRKWKQVLRFNGGSVDMDFDTDFWALSEFVAHRPVRDMVIELVNSFGLKKIKCVW